MTKQMLWLALAITAGAFGTARADVFAFKDLDGFEKCMNLDHLIESTKTDSGEQHRILGPDEIQPRCVEAAVKLLTPTKNKDLMFDFVKSTKRLSGPVQALPLISLLVDTSLPMCNEMENYEVVMRPLDNPPDRWAFPRSKSIIKRCLKDKDFKKDFLEEKDSESGYRGENACAILLEEKLVKSCKGGK
jgi:hypothetical protein